MSFLHSQSEQYYYRQNKIVSFVVNFVTMLGACVSVLHTFFPNKFLEITGGIFSIIIAALVKYYTSSNYTDLANIHKKSSSDFYKIYDSIQFVLSADRKFRPVGVDHIDIQRQSYNSTSESAPTLPKSILEEFNAKYKLNPISKPIIAGELSNINITREHQSKFTNSPPKNRKYQDWMRSNDLLKLNNQHSSVLHNEIDTKSHCTLVDNVDIDNV
jgi:hypothetical protein